MATEILRPRDVLASAVVPARLRRNYRRPQPNSDPRPSRKPSPKPSSPAVDTAAAAVKIRKNRKTRMEELYAGSAFSVSPAPSSVPLPSFCVIRREPSSPPPEKQAVDYSATQDLRRILRL